MSPQIATIDGSYAGGLLAYISNAKKLLEDSRASTNPLEGWTPSVPTGQMLEYGTNEEFLGFEEEGMSQVGRAAFVLVAGGLGERLGYSGKPLSVWSSHQVHPLTAPPIPTVTNNLRDSSPYEDAHTVSPHTGFEHNPN
jgi:hypothetical protein